MSRLITRVDPLEAQRIRDTIAGKRPATGGAKRPKAPPKPKRLVSQFHAYRTAGNYHLIQLPEHLEQPPRRVKPPSMSERSWRFYLRKRDEEYVALRTRTAEQVMHYMPKWASAEERSRLTRIEFVRISPLAGTTIEMDDDNLIAGFKAIRDAVCIVAQHGPAWPVHINAIGHADGFLKRRGVKWSYEQQKCEANPRAHGIQIRLYV